jgi:glycosyltransferase 2 family protein
MRSEALETSAPPQPSGWRRRATSLVSIVASAALLVGLYRSLDARLMVDTLLGADKLWLVISVGMILPITVLRAIRFFWVAPAGALPGVGEALRLTLAASALNVFLPAKAGDLVKSYFVAKRSDTPAGVSIAIIVYERLCDLFGLIFWCVVGWAVGRPDVPGVPTAFWLILAMCGAAFAVLISSERAAAVLLAMGTGALPRGKLQRVRKLAAGWPDLLRLLRGRRRWIVSFSLLLWLTHLYQMWLFTIALGVEIPFTICASLAAVALMVGQLPFTFSGLGTRDVALVVLMSRHMSAEAAAAMGVLMSTRNLLPPLIGLPMMWPYLSSVVGEARRWRKGMDPAK